MGSTVRVIAAATLSLIAVLPSGCIFHAGRMSLSELAAEDDSEKEGNVEQTSDQRVSITHSNVLWRMLVGDELAGVGGPEAMTLLTEMEQQKNSDAILSLASSDLPVDQAVKTLELGQKRLALHAMNFANVDTLGYKKMRIRMVSTGNGEQALSVQRDYSQGALQQTQGELDVCLMGHGFLMVLSAKDGEIVYSRAGNLVMNENGQLCLQRRGVSYLLDPPITIPSDQTGITIQADGRVLYKLPESAQMVAAGIIQLARFSSPEGLAMNDVGFYTETDSSGVPAIGTPSLAGFAALQQGYLEASNVEPLSEVVAIVRVRHQMQTLRKLAQQSVEK